MDYRLIGYRFTCQKCGSHSVTKILKPYGEDCFYSGYFMCSFCGTSLCDGQPIAYYSSCFHFINKPVQLDLFDYGNKNL